jgi:SAM-dependent methyltransferase
VSTWSDRAQAYRESETHRAGADLDLLVEWCEPAEGVKALDVATGGGHVARRLREAGAEVVTLDPSPGMQADVLAPAEHIPFDDGAFDVVVTRIAPHHFEDIRAAVAELERVSNRLVVVEDTLYSSELLTEAGLEVEQVECFEKEHPLEDWLARTGCEGEEAERVRELLADRMTDDGTAWVDTKLVIRARKSQS